MRKVITFFGVLKPQAEDIRYRYAGQDYSGKAFPEALAQFIDFDSMQVFVTTDAREKTWPQLTRLHGDTRIKCIDIPDGRDSAEMWAIFSELTRVVDEGDTVIFDITHGYRSIPFIVFLAAAYLKSARENVTIERVLYGALEQRPRDVTDAPAPVVDLTEFISLLDWMSATDHFVATGNSQALAEQVKAAGLSGTGAADDRLKLLELANSLESVSQSLRLLIPDKAMKASHQLQYRLQQAREPLQRELPPFLPLADRVDDAYSGMAMADPRDGASIWESLRRERRMVYWYLERQLLLQAIALAFEWLISYGMAHLGYDTLYDGRSRWTVRQQYTAINNQRKNGGSASTQVDDAWAALRPIPDVERVLDLYQRASKTRNDLMHASKTVHPKHTPASREDEIRAICRELAAFRLE